VQTWQPP